MCATRLHAEGAEGQAPLGARFNRSSRVVLWPFCNRAVFVSDLQAEDAEGETPLGAAAKHGKLRDALVAVAKGEMTLDDFMLA